MFNDLNQPNQPAAGTPPVDDIFAETDKSVEAKNFSGYYNQNPVAAPSAGAPTDIEAQKTGLSAGEDLSASSKGKIFKVVLIALFIILLIGLGYLVYTKFLVGQEVTEAPIINTNIPTTTQKVETDVATVTIPVSEELTVVTSTPLSTTTPPVSNLTDTDGDGLTDEEETVLGTDINLKDTDGDGLSDYDEVKVNNTSAVKVDTDGDGLSDYEEVKIYKTDPNIVDTDGDTYTDGAEVKSGYDPLVIGAKMTDTKK